MSVYLSAFLLAGWLAARLGLLAGGKNLKLEKFEVEVEEEKKKRRRRQFLTGHVEARGKEDEVNNVMGVMDVGEMRSGDRRQRGEEDIGIYIEA
ncbi:hypothetical protein TRV_02025 [Trichophyton verrucosum HKI 0517]|uniref:Uncharacterized protein n=1 Tax=Trichophyton verrucosum (strain HKI 0517) TaxID=663202 RepID=D4D4K8_TRIVH|nr:uncharacterized protein TRV_02025 [Trichophyton verrucosum HKI 0517]EFE43210.1 hypothetical protein TRV_02025 [Trichophyton verrucosum HKI 0517]